MTLKFSTVRVWLMLVPFVLYGCVGTIDRVVFITGTAPVTGNCHVVVTEESTKHVLRTESVRDEFSIDITMGELSPARLVVAVICDNRVLKEVNIVSVDKGAIDLGLLAP